MSIEFDCNLVQKNQEANAPLTKLVLSVMKRQSFSDISNVWKLPSKENFQPHFRNIEKRAKMWNQHWFAGIQKYRPNRFFFLFSKLRSVDNSIWSDTFLFSYPCYHHLSFIAHLTKILFINTISYFVMFPLKSHLQKQNITR